MSGALFERWASIQASCSEWASPYLHPEYTRLVAAAREDTYVGVLEKAGEAVGFFPHHRRRGLGTPVGERLTDVQAVVTDTAVSFDVDALLRGCGLLAWDFDHLLARRSMFDAHARAIDVSPGLDLSRGFDAWLADRKKASRRIKNLLNQRRKVIREVGAIRLVEHTEDAQVLERVIELKRAQCRRSGVPDFMSWPWVDRLVRSIHRARVPGFQGILSALYIGDDLVAAHLGMRTDRVWHWWFPVYEEQFAQHSPGAILLLEVAERAAADGIRFIDLGKGRDPYKSSFSNWEVTLLEGSAVRENAAGLAFRTARQAMHEGRRRVRESEFLEPVKKPLRNLRDQLRERFESSRA